METKSLPRWVPYVGYPAFFIFAFIIFLHLTLPYGVIQSRLVSEAQSQGYLLSMASLGPSLGFGVTARGVSITSAQPTASTAAPDAPPATGLVLDSVTVRPALFPMGISFSARAFGGELSGAFAQKGKTTEIIEVHGKNLELARAGLKPLVGLDMSGRVNVDADITTNPSDFTKTVGTVKLSGKELELLGGTVNYIDLPKATLGSLDIKLKADQGKATIDTLALTGGDLEAKGEGDITLGSRLNGSSVKAHLDFKPQDEWLNKKDNSIFKSGLSFAGHPNGSGFYTANLDGLLLSPRANLK